jgi:hypothetical protein
MMRLAKLGALGALLVATCLGLLWITEAVPRDQLEDVALKALGAVAILVVAGFAWSAIRGRGAGADTTDKPVP